MYYDNDPIIIDDINFTIEFFAILFLLNKSRYTIKNLKNNKKAMFLDYIIALSPFILSLLIFILFYLL